MEGGRTSARDTVEVAGEPGGQYVTADFALHPAVLAGTVRAINGRPVARAAVLAGGARAVTDAAGYYAFEELPAGQMEVRVSAPGWIGTPQEIYVGEAAGPLRQRLDFLSPPPSPGKSLTAAASRSPAPAYQCPARAR